MKFYSLLFALILLAFSNKLYSQNSVSNNWCATVEMQEKAYKEHPELLAAKQQFNDFLKQWKVDHANDAKRKSGTISYIIPVVFHVLHQYGSENISDAQIKDQMRIWNEDFQMRNADITDVIPYFQGITEDCEIEFRLATIDPNGNCTNGIDRIVTPLTVNAGDASKLNYWGAGSRKYLNIWTCASLPTVGTIAYAYKPGQAPSQKDGVLSLSNWIGSIGTSTYYNARVITHETAHCFGLDHCWGGTNNPAVASNCNIDDGVSDTPNTMGWDHCPSDLNSSTCSHPGIPDNIQNFLEYSFCSRMFTVGQAEDVMWPALESNFYTIYTMHQSSNLTATGTADPYDINALPLCAPKADFLSARQMICAGDSVKFTDWSWGGAPSSWDWTFTGGTPSFSSTQSPYIHYNTPGTYSVTLKSSNASGDGFSTRTNYIIVTDPTPVSPPFVEGFESLPFPSPGFVILNPDGGNTWVRATNAGAGGSSSSIMINNRTNTAGQVDEYITPAYDFTNMIPSLTYDRAYALWSSDTTRNDQLSIYYSLNCGQTWTLRSSNSGGSLATTTKKSSSWVPATADWKSDAVILPGSLNNKPNVRFKFKATSANGHNLYLDNINIGGTFIGIDDPDSPVSAFNVFPNPAKDQINVSITLEKASELKIELFDMTGRKVVDVANEKMATGVQNFPINQHLQDGVYLVRLTSGKTTSSKRVVVMN